MQICTNIIIDKVINLNINVYVNLNVSLNFNAYQCTLRARATLRGTVRKKMPPGKVYLSHCHVYYRRYIYVYDDYQIIIEVLQQE